MARDPTWLLLMLILRLLASTAAAWNLLAAPCSSSASPVQDLNAGSTFTAQLSGSNNAKAPFNMVVDEGGQKASWSLDLCDVPQYVASRLHVGSPPLVPLEPYAKPFSPNDLADQFLQLCPPQAFGSCSNRKGSFVAADLMSGSWNDLLNNLKSGNVVVNIASANAASGFMRANLAVGPPLSADTRPAARAAAPAAAGGGAGPGTVIVVQPNQPNQPEPNQPEPGEGDQTGTSPTVGGPPTDTTPPSDTALPPVTTPMVPPSDTTQTPSQTGFNTQAQMPTQPIYQPDSSSSTSADGGQPSDVTGGFSGGDNGS